MTTDTHSKEVSIEFTIDGKTCRMGAIAKGSGMIHPNMATMLLFITTDAKVEPAVLQAALSSVVPATFNQISVDGDTSTNDTVLLLASGLSGAEVQPGTADYDTFVAALTQVAEQLSRELAGDGEGATKLLECIVTGAPDLLTARAVSKSVIHSALFKAAMFGEDANWGRVLCAIGYTPGDFDISKTAVRLKSKAGEVFVCENAAYHPYSEDEAAKVLKEDEIQILVDLGLRPDLRLRKDQRRLPHLIQAGDGGECAMKNEEMALLFSEATPYIQKYHGKTLVIKYGGNAMVNDELKLAVMNDLVTLTLLGVRVVLVHGGGPAINKMLARVGKESKFVGGLRYTDEETMGIVQQVLAGQVNKDLVALLKGRGVGLCGMDGHTITCSRKSDVDLGYVGEIEKVDTTLIEHLLADSFIPVIATVGMDDNGIPYNINADTAAAEIAIALHAEKLVSMTDIVGLLYDKNDESTLIPEVEVSEIEGYKAAGVIAGGMLPKIEGMADAIYEGVHEAVIIDGRVPHSILLEMFSDRGAGTMFYRRGNH